MHEEFTTEESSVILRALRHLKGDYPQISDQLRQMRDRDAFTSALTKLEATAPSGAGKRGEGR